MPRLESDDRGREDGREAPAGRAPLPVAQGATLQRAVLDLQRGYGNAAVASAILARNAGAAALPEKPGHGASDAVSQLLRPGGPTLQRNGPDPPAAAGSEPAPETTRISPLSTVQDAKESVRDAMDVITHNQVFAIGALERTSEIKDPPPSPDIISEIIMGLVVTAATLALGGIAETIAAGITRRIAFYSRSAAGRALFLGEGGTAKGINSFIEDALKAGAMGYYARLNGPPGPLGATPQIAYFQNQKTLVEKQGQERKTIFNNQAAEYDRMPIDQAINELQVLKEAHDFAATREASNSHSHIYMATLAGFANLVAELRNGTRTGRQHSRNEQDAADLRGGGTQGVLNLTLVMARPDDRPTIRSARLDGIPAELREILAGKKIGDLGMNLEVNGTVSNLGPEARDTVRIEASRNSGGTVGYGPWHQGVEMLNFFAHRAAPSEDRWLWSQDGPLGSGPRGVIKRGQRTAYQRNVFGDSREATRTLREFDEAVEDFKELAWTGARLFIEHDVHPLHLPRSVGGRAE